MSDRIRQILESNRTIAIVGMSDKPNRASHEVGHYLQTHGYRIVPVNPLLAGQQVLGETVHADLPTAAAALQAAGEAPIDMVDVFRKSEDVPPVADQAIAIGARTLWLQLAITHPEAEQKAADAGLQVVHDKCTKIEHALLA